MTRRLVVFGLSISSSWGNGHAPTFRGLVRALAARGWEISFFEQDVEWYRSNRDLPEPEFCELRLYADLPRAMAEAAPVVQAADAVLVGSLVASGQAIVDWLATRSRPMFFYDIDTPITLMELNRRDQTEYVRADQIPHFAAYLSFAGGPALDELERRWGARHAEALYCGVDPDVYRPVPTDARFACSVGYMGTYAADRQPALEELLIAPARVRSTERFLLAGPQYPPMDLPDNVDYVMHVYPRDHAAFYVSSHFTLNLTRAAMRRYGWAPSTRLFEAAASGACIVSDIWPGLESIFDPDSEILLAETRTDMLRHLASLTAERRHQIGQAARRRVLDEHTYDRRAQQFEQIVDNVIDGRRAPAGTTRCLNVS